MFSLAKANVKDTSVPSDLEDGKFVVQIALDLCWNRNLGCSSGFWEEQMESHVCFNLKRQNAEKYLEKNLTFKHNAYTVTGFGYDARKNSRLLFFPIALLFLYHHLPSCLYNSVVGCWQSNHINAIQNYIILCFKHEHLYEDGAYTAKDKKHARLEYSIRFFEV